MTPFHRYVVMFTILILIVWTFVIIWLFRKLNNNTGWPSLIGACPDYWLDQSPNSDGGQCVPNHKLTNIGNLPPPVDPQDFSGSNIRNPNCDRYNYSNNHNIAWGGITYGGPNPCLTTS